MIMHFHMQIHTKLYSYYRFIPPPFLPVVQYSYRSESFRSDTVLLHLWVCMNCRSWIQIFKDHYLELYKQSFDSCRWGTSCWMSRRHSIKRASIPALSASREWSVLCLKVGLLVANRSAAWSNCAWLQTQYEWLQFSRTACKILVWSFISSTWLSARKDAELIMPVLQLDATLVWTDWLLLIWSMQRPLSEAL